MIPERIVEFEIKVCDGDDVGFDHGIEPDTYTAQITLDLADVKGVQNDPKNPGSCWLWFGGFGPEGEPQLFEVSAPYREVASKWSVFKRGDKR